MKKAKKISKKLHDCEDKSCSYHHGDLKSALLKVALKMLETQSPDLLSLRELARKAGVSQAAPYRHFKDKADLLAALSLEGFELKYELMFEAVSKYSNPKEKLIACAHAYLNMGLMHPQHFNLMCKNGVLPSPEYPDLLNSAAKTFILLKELVEDCQKAGDIGAGDPSHIAMNCWLVVDGYTSRYTAGGLDFLGITKENAEAGLQTLVSQFLEGMDKPLRNMEFGCQLFQTEYSQVIKANMDLIKIKK